MNSVKPSRAVLALRYPALILLCCVLSSCGLQQGNDRHQDPTGEWESTDGESFLNLREDHTGTFTLCNADIENEGRRYNFDSADWPATIAITWATSDPASSEPDGRLYLEQDWASYESTGTGFRASNVILDWEGAALEMGADLVVRYVRVEGVGRTC